MSEQGEHQSADMRMLAQTTETVLRRLHEEREEMAADE